MRNVIKRDGSLEPFSKSKVRSAMKNAFSDVGVPFDKECFDAAIAAILDADDNFENIPIWHIQDTIETTLSLNGHPDVAKSFILYRAEHDRIREWVAEKKEYIKNYKASFNTADATIDDNSNIASKNIAIMNNEIHKPDNVQISRRMVMDKLKEIYPTFNSKQYVRDLKSRRMYKHDESSYAGAYAPYCMSGSMYPFLQTGIKELGGLSSAPKNLDSYCGMFINYIFAVSSQFAGAVATPEFLVYFDHYARKEWGQDYFQQSDGFYKIGPKFRELLNASHYWCNTVNELKAHDFGSEELNNLRDEIVYESERPLTEEELKTYKNEQAKNPEFSLKLGDGTRTIRGQIHQYFQQVIYSINQPAAARGMQAAFVNFAYFDSAFFEGMFGEFQFPDGDIPCWDSVKWIQKVFMQWFNDERLRTMLTFPVESFALVYQNGHFIDQESADFVADEYARGHSFFTYISDTVDSLSSCCRLKNMLTTKEFNFTNGNMGIMTGSKSVITLNLNRLIQDFVTSDEGLGISAHKAGERINQTDLWDFTEYLEKILERVYMYHTAYNELLWEVYDAGLLPAYSAHIIDLNKQYLTIGLNGLNQAAEYIGLDCTDNEDYRSFCEMIFSTVKDCNSEHNGKFNGHQLTFNTEQVPAESLAVKNYNWDKEDGYWVPEDTNLYASYIFKPNDARLTIFDKLRMHGSGYIGEFLDGGAAAHINLSEHLTAVQYKAVLEYAAKVGCQYFTFNIPNSECDDCGWIGKTPVEKCPHCGSEHISHWDRVIGYLTKIRNWSKGRRIEQKTRVYSKVTEDGFAETLKNEPVPHIYDGDPGHDNC